MALLSRQEAVALGKTRYFTGIPCKHGHVSERMVSNKSCVACMTMWRAAWEAEHPDRHKQKRLRFRLAKPWACFHAARQRAIKKGVPFDLDVEWARATWTGKCAITGIPFAGIGVGVVSPFSATVDRIVPEKGYVKGNCRFVLHAINNMKGSGTDEDMVAIARRIVEVYDAR